jgi:Wall-associated receptor kinase galacturonan-binding
MFLKPPEARTSLKKQKTEIKIYLPNSIMKHKKYSPTVRVMAMAMLIIMAIMQFHTAESVEPAIALEGCQDTCGGVRIPYPFGIGPNCSLGGFDVECNTTYNPPKLIFHTVKVHNISLSSGQIRVNNPISSQCYDPNYNNISNIKYQWNLSGIPFRFNNEKNKFTVIGCNTLAYIEFGNETDLNWGGGVSFCSGKDSIINGSCSGIGCCQTAIPKQTNYYYITFADTYGNSTIRKYNFSLCSYAVLMEDEGFVFSSDYITTNKLYNQQMPVVLDWAIGNETCKIAQANKTSYVCISDDSVCVNSINGPGYLCNCSDGYEGNPYLRGGCQGLSLSLSLSLHLLVAHVRIFPILFIPLEGFHFRSFNLILQSISSFYGGPDCTLQKILLRLWMFISYQVSMVVQIEPYKNITWTLEVCITPVYP